MNAPRFASLSGTLLARKGGAKPAMRPRPLSQETMLDDLGWNDMGDPTDRHAEHVPSSIAGLTPAPKIGIAPRDEAPELDEAPPVHAQQRAIADRFGADEDAEETPVLPEPVVTALRAPAPNRTGTGTGKGKAGKALAEGRKAAFTLRLDGDRHLRLRLASAVTGKSSQQLVTGALDALLDTLPEVRALAQHLPAGGVAKN